MPRSSRHKSSKHSSREAIEHSDSEKDSSLKERKGKEESGGVRASKDFGSNEKRKLDLKDGKESHGGSGNGEYSEDYISSKRRKERSDGRASDRWNGGEDDYYGRGEGTKKSSKASGDSKSKRRDDSVGTYEEREEFKKNSSSGKGEGRHRDRDLTRKEGRESAGVERDKEKERERKSTDGRSERLGSNDHHGAPKQVVDNTDLNAHVDVGSPGLQNQMERQTRKGRDGSLDVDKYEDDIGDTKARRLSSRDDSGKYGRLKDEKYKDKQREDLDRQRDERPAKDYHPSSRSEDKQFRNEKDTEEMFQKRSKLKDSERKVENAHDYDHGRNRDSELRDRDRERDRGRSRGHDYDRDWDHDYDLDHDHDRNRDRRRDRQRDHDREHDRDRDRDHDYDREYGGPRHDDRAVRHRDTSRGRRGSPDGQDDINDSQSRSIKACFSDMENKPSTGDRNVEVSKGRSQSRQAYSDKSSNKWRTSPSSNSHIILDDNRNMNPEDFKYKDSTSEQRLKAVPPRDVSVPPGLSDRGNKYRSTEKSTKIDDYLLGELSYERSSFKASPLGTVERSPSPPSIERRCVKRSVARRSLDIEETGQRGGADFRITEDRPSRDLLTEKPDNSSPADSSFYNRSNQGNSSSLVSPRPGFRVGLGSPSFIGSLEDDGRVNSNARYRRNSDPNMGRAHGNAWRGVPNWASPVPNGFIPFQHGPPSGGFQGMMPQFPGTLFGVRPSMEINHSGMPYHMADAERFSSHLRPLGWHNLMDGSGPSHVHGWDGSNGAFREEPHIYGTAEWDQNRHPFSGHGWESSTEMWKGQNGEAKRDMPSPSHKDDYPVPVSEDDVGQAGHLSNNNDSYNQGIDERFAEKRSSVASPVEESTPKNIHEKTPDHSKSRRNDVSHLSSYYYLSKVDISAELVHPEVYNQCMNLLGTQQNTTVDDDTNMHIILQHDSRAGLKASNSLWISSHFPLREGVFKRAMDLYEKQRLETRCTSFLKEGMLEDPILASNQENMEEQVEHDIEKVEDQVITKDEKVIDCPIPTIDQKDIKSVSSAVAEDKLGEFLSAPAKEPDGINLHSPKLEESVQYHNQEELGETEPTSCEEMEAISSEQVKSGKVDAKGVASVNTAPPIATPLAIGDDFIGISKINGGHSLSCDEEGVSFADAMRVPICIPSGSPMACEGMISESNESVILSRIHHSPESTH